MMSNSSLGRQTISGRGRTCSAVSGGQKRVVAKSATTAPRQRRPILTTPSRPDADLTDYFFAGEDMHMWAQHPLQQQPPHQSHHHIPGQATQQQQAASAPQLLPLWTADAACSVDDGDSTADDDCSHMWAPPASAALLDGFEGSDELHSDEELQQAAHSGADSDEDGSSSSSEDDCNHMWAPSAALQLDYYCENGAAEEDEGPQQPQRAAAGQDGARTDSDCEDGRETQSAAPARAAGGWLPFDDDLSGIWCGGEGFMSHAALSDAAAAWGWQEERDGEEAGGAWAGAQ